MPSQPKPDIINPLRTRIAPTPSGYLHLGNIFSFALTWAIARKQDGIVALRVDDLDNSRFREEYLQDIFNTLQFLGIDYDEGPKDAADFHQNYSQQKHTSSYNSMLQKLAEQKAVYACPCSRRELTGRMQETNYPFTCRDKQHPLDVANAAWRIRIPEDTVISFNDILLQHCTVNLTERHPDFVVKRKDGLPAYQIASVCDDMRMGITLVVRGEDLLPSTASQLYLAHILGITALSKIQFLHHPLLYDTDGGKLSKSHGSLSIKEMRNNGASAGDIWKKIAGYLNWQDAASITNAQQLLERFRLDDLFLITKTENARQEQKAS